RYSADATLMLAYPGTAATIIKEMARGGDVRWYFSPMLHDDALLWNVPKGILENSVGVAPSLSSNAECNVVGEVLGGSGGADDSLDCDASAAERFARYYADRWTGEEPLRGAHYYYDAVIMLALGLERAAADGLSAPKPQELLPYFTGHADEDEHIAWDSLDEGLQLARDGSPVDYLGAAGDYEFNARGQNIRAIVDTWVISGEHRFI